MHSFLTRRGPVQYIAAVAASLLFAAVLLSLLPIHGEERIYENVIRFHVIAASDEAKDQALKLKVRDEILDYAAPLLAPCTSFDEAYAALEGASEELRDVAEKTVRENGQSCSVDVCLTVEAYPEREYDAFRLPAGKYTSMKITLGEGDGHNWWCVLFPSVCRTFSVEEQSAESGQESDNTDGIEEAYLAVGFTPEQYRMIVKDTAPEYRVRFKILELLAALFE